MYFSRSCSAKALDFQVANQSNRREVDTDHKDQDYRIHASFFRVVPAYVVGYDKIVPLYPYRNQRVVQHGDSNREYHPGIQVN